MSKRKESGSDPRSPSRLRRATDGTVAALLFVLALLSGFAGLPWWLSVAVAVTLLVFGVRSYMIGRLPLHPAEIVLLAVLCGGLMLASREAGDLVSSDMGSHQYFVTTAVAYSRIAPLATTVVVDDHFQGEEVEVVCWTDGFERQNRMWLRLENGSYVLESDLFRELASIEEPERCDE